MVAGSWSLVEELFARGDAGFVDELRRVHLADRLGAFAARWLADPRPFARAQSIQRSKCYGASAFRSTRFPLVSA